MALRILNVTLFHRRSRFSRGIAVVLAVLTWLVSGFMNFAAMFRGI